MVSVKTVAAQKEFYEMNKLFKRSSFRYMSNLGRIMNQCETEIRKYPLMILCGDRDIPFALELSEKWNVSETNSKFHKISNAGHCANMDNPIEFNAVLDGFLESVGL